MKSSTTSRDADNDAWAVEHNLFFVALFADDAAIPDDPADATTATKLLVCSVNNDGTTGGTWAASSGGILSRTSSEILRGTGLSTGTAAFGRIYFAGDDPATADGTKKRLQGVVGTDFIFGDAAITISVDKDLGNIQRVRPLGV